MLIKQLSVFLENKSGRLTEVSKILGDCGINMLAFSVADTSEFGILRLIVSDPERACKVLHDNDFSVNLTEVVCMNCGGAHHVRHCPVNQKICHRCVEYCPRCL